MKDGLGKKIMTNFVRLRPNIYSYLADNGCYDRKAKSTKKCIIN